MTAFLSKKHRNRENVDYIHVPDIPTILFIPSNNVRSSVYKAMRFINVHVCIFNLTLNIKACTCLYVNQKKIREIQISVEIKLYHTDNFKEDHIRNGLELRVFFSF